jgi:transposase
VAISAAEEPLGEVRVRASAAQADRLLAWAAAWPHRTWAVEGAGGIGHLLAQQLLAAGERVLDVQPKLGARVRLLAAGDTNKNEPNDARPVAVAALRSPGVKEARADDHAAVLRMSAKRHRDLGRTRTQIVCRLHAVLCELVPGGVPKAIIAAQAAQVLEAITPSGPVQAARCELAAEFLEDLRHIDSQLDDIRKKLATAVRASGTSLTGLFGVGPVIAATVIGGTRDVSRFPTATTSPPTTGPRRSRCRPGIGRSTGCHGAGTGGLTTPSTWPRLPRSGSGTAPAAPTSRRSWPRARPAKKHSAPQTAPACKTTPTALAPASRAREGNRGTTPSPAWPGSHPHAPALRPSHSRTPPPAYDSKPCAPSRNDQQARPEDPAKGLDAKRLRYTRRPNA